jgi:DNA polymerase III alpha subunit
LLVYQNYHRHSHYTNTRVPDSVVTNEDYAKRAVELGQTILSSCEHGWQGNYAECYDLAKANGLKLLFASEAYWVKDRLEKDKTNCHIFLAAKNERGRQALNDVLSEANISGFYNRPRVDLPLLLSLPADDIWCTSACIAGWLYEDADECWKQMADHFGKNFFLEVQYHNCDFRPDSPFKGQAELNQHVLELSRSWGVPIIMGCDSHYILPSDAQARTDYTNSKGIEYEDETGMILDFPDGDTAYQRFAQQAVLSHDEIMEAINNTNVFAEVEEYDSPIFNTDIKMPSMYPGWTQEQKDDEYKRLVLCGWDAYKSEVPEEKWTHYEEEIAKEMQVVIDTKMSDYFILNHHVIKRGKENGGWLTRTGRGSAGSFFTNKLLGFTEMDRISAPVHMYPERFMSTERILQSGSLPDIDFNVADAAPFAKAQKEVLGEEHAYPMLAYGTMLTSAAWKLYAKAQDIPFEIANEVSNQIKRYEMAVKHAEEDEKDDIDVYDYISPQYKDVFEGSKGYRGIISSWSIAPCAYLLYGGNIRKEIGLVRIKDNLCCCMDGHWAERNHFLKNDLLTVKVVDLIYQIFHRIGMEPPSVTELLKWCATDDKVWDLYKRGATMCLNQVERSGTSARVAKYQPRNISELSAFIAAIRPGFKSLYKTFESRVPFSYGVKAFDNLIQTNEMPNSYVLYQEQEMQALHYAGIPMSECYTAIKNIAKKRKEKVLAYKDVFKKGFAKAIVEDEGKSEEEADELTNKLWQIIEDSASYSFNASHSYCVALDSLYEAWLKANHPLEFYEVALNLYEQKGDKDKVAALKEEAEKYFDILFPPMRYGQDNRQMRADPATNSIVNSLGSIKGMSKAMGAKLYECARQDHKSFFDVLKWLDERSIKSAKVIPLVKIDYFNSFGNNVELLRLITWWDFFKQGTAKTISKDKLSPAFEEMLSRYASDKSVKGEPLKSYKINDMDGLLEAIEEYVFSLHLEELPYRVKAANQNEILGYVDMTTQKEEDRRKLYLLDVRPLIGKWNAGKPWKYIFHCKSVGSGKVSQLSVTPYRYNNTITKALKGDIILAKHVHKNEKGYWELDDYEILPG